MHSVAIDSRFHSTLIKNGCIPDSSPTVQCRHTRLALSRFLIETANRKSNLSCPSTAPLLDHHSGHCLHSPPGERSVHLEEARGILGLFWDRLLITLLEEEDPVHPHPNPLPHPTPTATGTTTTTTTTAYSHHQPAPSHHHTPPPLTEDRPWGNEVRPTLQGHLSLLRQGACQPRRNQEGGAEKGKGRRRPFLQPFLKELLALGRRSFVADYVIGKCERVH